MNLTKDNWTIKDIGEFEKHLTSFSKGKEKSEWEKRIVNTKMSCLAVPSYNVKQIVKEISKGNFESFIEIWPWNYFTETTIIGSLICKIKDFNTFENYLLKYAKYCDNWATCDCLKIRINKTNKEQIFDMAYRFTKMSLIFEKRLGITTLFKFVDDDKYINQIFDIADSFEEETEYYVNMALSWLIAECFTKQRDKTLEFLKNNHLNKFVQNKAISKCRDSYRISKEDKELLLSYKK